MKISPDWLNNPSLQTIMWTLGDGEVFAVGGCVRDSIIGRPVNDVDLATSLTPSEVKECLEQISGVTLYPTGIEHGTWSVLIDNDLYEITTFRHDVATDGRRATVSYAKTMAEDAQRRDFTMNALYVDRHGQVYDPTGQGLQDAQDRYIRFVGDADMRCKEDYLRILRLFRFYAQIGEGRPLDKAALVAVFNNVEGLYKVSGERKWAEIQKILGANEPCPALVHMERCGVLDIVLEDYSDSVAVWNVVQKEKQAQVPPKWQRRYAALMDYAEIPFPCSRQDQQSISTLKKHAGQRLDRVAFLTKNVAVAIDCYILHCASVGIRCEPFPAEAVERFVQMKCPIDADAFIRMGIKPGAGLGKLLKDAEELFIESGFTATKHSITEHMFGP